MKWAIASFVVISRSEIANFPTVNLKLKRTVLGGIMGMLNLATASCVKDSPEVYAKTLHFPISEMESHVISVSFFENHLDSLRGGVFPIPIVKISCITTFESSQFKVNLRYNCSTNSSNLLMFFSLFSIFASILPRISTIRSLYLLL